jgi:uncharacterized protein YybS (DUF2232 family)
MLMCSCEVVLEGVLAVRLLLGTVAIAGSVVSDFDDMTDLDMMAEGLWRRRVMVVVIVVVLVVMTAAVAMVVSVAATRRLSFMFAIGSNLVQIK